MKKKVLAMSVLAAVSSQAGAFQFETVEFEACAACAEIVQFSTREIQLVWPQQWPFDVVTALFVASVCLARVEGELVPKGTE